MSSKKLFPSTWVDRYSDYLYNYTIVRVNDHEIAQDLISETFLAGLKSAKNFKGDEGEKKETVYFAADMEAITQGHVFILGGVVRFTQITPGKVILLLAMLKFSKVKVDG